MNGQNMLRGVTDGANLYEGVTVEEEEGSLTTSRLAKCVSTCKLCPKE